MNKLDFSNIVQLLKRDAPAKWSMLKVDLRYLNSISKAESYYRATTNSEFERFNTEGFDILRAFETLIDQSRSANPDDNWSKLIITIDSKGKVNSDFYYGDPDLFGI